MKTTARTLGALVLAITVSGCGAAGAPVAQQAAQQAAELAPEALLKLVGEKTSAAKSAKVDTTATIGASSASMKGDLDWQNGLKGELTGKADSGPMKQAFSTMGGDGTFTARYLSDAFYVNMGEGMAAKLQGRHWLRYGYDDLAKLMGPAGDSMKNQFKNADPVAAVRGLIASGKVTKVGTDTVNGTKTTKFTGDLSLDDLTTAAGKNGLTPDQVDALKQQFTTAGISTDHIEVWVNADNLLVKKSEDIQSKNGAINSTAVYSDYGTPVSVDAPEAADTFDFAEIMKMAKGGGVPKS